MQRPKPEYKCQSEMVDVGTFPEKKEKIMLYVPMGITFVR